MRVPLLAGTRVVVARLDDDVELLLPPRPAEGIANVEAAVRDALRFPLAGPSLEQIVPAGGRVTILLDAWALPLPPPEPDPRQAALTAAIDELERIGVRTSRVTILVASGLARRAGRADLETRVTPTLARRFGGTATAHDVESPELIEVGEDDGERLAVARQLVEADAVVIVTSAETVLDGGPAALLAASSAEAIRGVAATPSLLELGGAAWQRAVAIERALARRVPIVGVSLALAHPRWGGLLNGFPYRRGRIARVARNPLIPAFDLLPGPLRRRTLVGHRPEADVQAVFAGPPSVAHAEALLRAVELRSRTIEHPVDALVIGAPPLTHVPPLERQNPLGAAYLALGLALRLHRGDPALAEGGILIFPHRMHRRFAHPTQTPYRAFFAALRSAGSREPEHLAAAERTAASDSAALAAYRGGRTCHPLLPFADWAACSPARRRLGTILVAGCRDATAARLLGFVPVKNLATALSWVRQAGGGEARIGCVPTPPYFPLSAGPSPAPASPEP